MTWRHLLNFFRRPGDAASTPTPTDDRKLFEKLHHSFKLFLTEWNNFQETMTQVEYTLCCDHPFGMQRVRKLCTGAATQVFQCIRQLRKLDPVPCDALFSRFAQLQEIVAGQVYEREIDIDGPDVLPCDHPRARALCDAISRWLSGARGGVGIVVTHAGCRRFLRDDLQTEITRRIQASGGPVRARLTKLSQSLGDLVRASPVPDDLARQMCLQLTALRDAAPGRRLLPCLRLWPLSGRSDLLPDSGPSYAPGDALADAQGAQNLGLLFKGASIPSDASPETFLSAFRDVLANAQQRTALVYKREHGLTEFSVGLCVVFLALPENCGIADVQEGTADGDCRDVGIVGAAGAEDGHDYMPGSPVFRILQNAAQYILPLTLDVDSVDFAARNCATYHDIARYCHERAISSMFAVGSGKGHADKHVKQLRDGILKQFWVVNLNDGFVVEPKGPVIDISQITSRPMLPLWRGMNVYPWQGPPPMDGKGFMAVLFEATANPHLDPAAQTAYFSEKNYFMITRNYCSLHSRFGFHFVSVEARLSERKRENYLIFQLRGGAADIERRILRVRLVAELLWEFGFRPQVRNDAVAARLEGLTPEDGEQLLAVAGYMTIHTRQLDMIMQDAAQVGERRERMLSHCRALFTGRPLPVAD
ncbi:MAG: hypothetical protein LBR31_08405 [Desulfovibrio sp.]|jgi:hypothetical protein|nr:hypothetical protein [Desulfovibrio sp.]